MACPTCVAVVSPVSPVWFVCLRTCVLIFVLFVVFNSNNNNNKTVTLCSLSSLLLLLSSHIVFCVGSNNYKLWLTRRPSCLPPSRYPFGPFHPFRVTFFNCFYPRRVCVECRPLLLLFVCFFWCAEGFKVQQQQQPQRQQVKVESLLRSLLDAEVRLLYLVLIVRW